MDKDAKQKWDGIYAKKNTHQIQPAYVLTEYQYLLPKTGVALDLACGLGGNAIFLAQRGLDTHAWDISDHAIQKLTRYCENKKISLTATVRDVQELPPVGSSFDVICITFYLERDIAKNIISALKPNGLLFYQTFIAESVSENGPHNPKYRLGENELLAMFSTLHILVYQELGIVGDSRSGLRDNALLIAQKR